MKLLRFRYCWMSGLRMCSVSPDIVLRHKEACSKEEITYTDPRTGYKVMTAFSLRQRGNCCGNFCRHCPYGHFNVPEELLNGTRTANSITDPILLKSNSAEKGVRSHLQWLEDPKRIQLFVWTGDLLSIDALYTWLKQGDGNCGSDRAFSFLGLVHPSDRGDIALCSDVSLRIIMDQARSLNVDLLVIPTTEEGDFPDFNSVCQKSIFPDSTVVTVLHPSVNGKAVNWQSEMFREKWTNARVSHSMTECDVSGSCESPSPELWETALLTLKHRSSK